MKNLSAKINLSVHYTHKVCLWPTPLCSSSRLCCIFFTYKGDILVLKTSSVCKIVSHLPVAHVRVPPSNPDYPRREESSSRHAVIVSMGSDIFKRHFVHSVLLAVILYLLGNKKEVSSCLGCPLVWQLMESRDDGTSCQGHLVDKDPKFSTGEANALGNL